APPHGPPRPDPGAGRRRVAPRPPGAAGLEGRVGHPGRRAVPGACGRGGRAVHARLNFSTDRRRRIAPFLWTRAPLPRGVHSPVHTVARATHRRALIVHIDTPSTCGRHAGRDTPDTTPRGVARCRPLGVVSKTWAEHIRLRMTKL